MSATYSDLQQITHRFYYCLDEQRYDDLVALMRPDARWHRQGKVLDGHAAIRDALNERPRSQVIRHVITNTFVDGDSGNEATLNAYMTAYRFDDGTRRERPVTITGPFRMLLVRKRFVREAGGWLIAESIGTVEFEFGVRA
jgi:hypothetical protein